MTHLYNPEHLTADELEHYAGLGLVKGIEPKAGALIVGKWISALIDFEHEHDRANQMQNECASLEDECASLEDECAAWENLAEDAKANLRVVLRELHILFVKFPNLKNSMPDLHAAYLQMKD
jgi:hypothetical protein